MPAPFEGTGMSSSGSQRSPFRRDTESRRQFLQRLSAAGAVSTAASLFCVGCGSSERAPATTSNPSLPIQHVVIACQENHSFDNYYGFAPFVGAYGVPAGYSQPDGPGGRIKPYHFGSLTPLDVPHDWWTTHQELDHGRMDGFYTTAGIATLGYYTAADLPYYYSLFENFTVCVNYFCSLLGPTRPNRLYLCSGTSGGNTTNNIAPGALNYYMILDLFEQFGISWKNYYVGGLGINASLLFAKWEQDARQNFTEQDYYNDLADGTFPHVAFISCNHDEHPPDNIQQGMESQRNLIIALMNSPYWQSSAYILTYDEGGGFFDHIQPPTLDAYGAGIRVPTWVISPYAKKSNLQATLYEHSSVLKFIERVFNLPTLASINHEFDNQTPGANNDAAGAGRRGPAAPPRDALAEIGDLMDCFDFNQRP